VENEEKKKRGQGRHKPKGKKGGREGRRTELDILGLCAPLLLWGGEAALKVSEDDGCVAGPGEKPPGALRREGGREAGRKGEREEGGGKGR